MSSPKPELFLLPARKTVKTSREVLQAMRDRLQQIEWDRKREQWQYEKFPDSDNVPCDPPERVEEMQALNEAIEVQENVVAAEDAEEAGVKKEEEVEAKKEEDDAPKKEEDEDDVKKDEEVEENDNLIAADKIKTE